jgi:glutathione S-transferase
MLTLFHAPQSRSSRLVWLIEELGAECRVEYCDIRRMGGSGAPDPKNPHPDGKVPALIHDGALVTESAAVALYLTDLFPQADIGAPAGSRDRAAYLTWLTWGAGEMEPAIWGRISGAAEREPALHLRYDQAMGRLLEALWDGPWLMGDRFTAADVMIGASLGWGREHLPDSPLFDLYLERLAQRPAWIRAQVRDADPQLCVAA